MSMTHDNPRRSAPDEGYRAFEFSDGRWYVAYMQAGGTHRQPEHPKLYATREIARSVAAKINRDASDQS